jgi:hypothetical protein
MAAPAHPMCAAVAARYKIASSLPAAQADKVAGASSAVGPAEKAAAFPVGVRITASQSVPGTVASAALMAVAAPAEVRSVVAEPVALAETDTFRETLDRLECWQLLELVRTTTAPFVR